MRDVPTPEEAISWAETFDHGRLGTDVARSVLAALADAGYRIAHESQVDGVEVVPASALDALRAENERLAIRVEKLRAEIKDTVAEVREAEAERDRAQAAFDREVTISSERRASADANAAISIELDGLLTEARAERDRYREALERIGRLRDRWAAPLSHPVGDMSDPAYAGAAAWAAVGSEADAVARAALAAPVPKEDENEC